MFKFSPISTWTITFDCAISARADVCALHEIIKERERIKLWWWHSSTVSCQHKMREKKKATYHKYSFQNHDDSHSQYTSGLWHLKWAYLSSHYTRHHSNSSNSSNVASCHGGEWKWERRKFNFQIMLAWVKGDDIGEDMGERERKFKSFSLTWFHHDLCHNSASANRASRWHNLLVAVLCLRHISAQLLSPTCKIYQWSPAHVHQQFQLLALCALKKWMEHIFIMDSELSIF